MPPSHKKYIFNKSYEHWDGGFGFFFLESSLFLCSDYVIALIVSTVKW